MRQMQVDKQTRVSIAQSLAYANSLFESSSARHHCALIGIRCATTLVLSPKLVAVEVADWSSTGKVVGVRELLSNLSHESLPHSLLREDGQLDAEAFGLFQGWIRAAIIDQAHRDASTPLNRVALGAHTNRSVAEYEAQIGSRIPFSVEEEDRLSVVRTARSVSTHQTSSKSKEEHGCSTGGEDRHDKDDGGAGGSGGSGSAGTGQCNKRAARTARTGGSQTTTSTSTAAGSASTHSKSRTATTASADDANALSLDLGGSLAGLDISDQLGPEDLQALNAANESLPLGADAESFAASIDADPELLASLLREEKHGPLSVKRWAANPENGDFVLAVLTAALEDLGCMVKVVSPDEMSQLRAEERRVESPEGSREHFPSSTQRSPALPELDYSDETSSPSPVSTAQLHTVLLPRVTGEEPSTGATPPEPGMASPFAEQRAEADDDQPGTPATRRPRPRETSATRRLRMRVAERRRRTAPP